MKRYQKRIRDRVWAQQDLRPHEDAGKSSLKPVFHLLSAKVELFSSIFHQLFPKSFTTTHGASHISQTGIFCGTTLDSGVRSKRDVYFAKIAGGSEGSPDICEAAVCRTR